MFFVRCKERNIILKMTKSWFGVREVTFFGLHLKDRLVTLSNNRVEQVQKLIMPSNQKQMQFYGLLQFL